MRTRAFVLGAWLCAAVMLTFAQAPGERQSQGALVNRPGADRAPEFPTPSIRDYKPVSTADLVLRKLYYQNALKLLPGLPRAGFPELTSIASLFPTAACSCRTAHPIT